MEVPSVSLRELIRDFAIPMFMIQADPRQIVTANRTACELFGKQLSEIEGLRAGKVFNCVHSYSEAGCGEDKNCEGCKIRNAVVDTLETGKDHNNISTTLNIKKSGGIYPYDLQVSTDKKGDFVLLAINSYVEKS